MTKVRGKAAVGLRCDATPEGGVGHAVRCLALAQELRRRGLPVELFGDLSVAWVRRAYTQFEIPVHPADALASAALSHAVLDGYRIDGGVGAALRAENVRVLAMVDGPFGAQQDADIYVDQNWGAQAAPVAPGRTAVAGIGYALFRDNVLAARTLPRPVRARPQVLVVFGGTDPLRACPDYVAALLHTGLPVCVVAIAADDDIQHRLAALQPGVDQEVQVVPVPPDLPAVAASCDAAVSAAGSTIWELLTIGVPTASVCVVDNQEPGYATTWRDRLVLPGGRLSRLRAGDGDEQEQSVQSLRRLISDADLRRSLADGGRDLIDGAGRQRVADLLLA